MSTTGASVRDLPPEAQQNLPPTEAAIRRQLESILASPTFHGSRRCQQFLKCVCEKSLAGEAAALKERTIAIEVFGRQPESDLSEDTIVRVGAREVRRRLAQYYATPDGASSEVRIDLPSGSYVPDFRYAFPTRVEELGPPAVVAAVDPVPARRPRVVWIGTGAAAILLAAAGIFAFSGGNPNTAAFQRFWEPVFHDPAPLLVAVAHPIVYHASGRAVRLSEERQPSQEIPHQRPIQLAPDEFTGADLVPVFNQYVGFGDMVAATEVASMIGRNAKAKAVRVRMASGVEFADLRKAPTLLIGAITNRWTLELQQAWRYRFVHVPGTRTVIVDTQDASGARQWAISGKDDGSSPEDYILVSRIRSGYTGGLLLVAAGLKQFGTEAAGRLLVDPDSLGSILRKLPEGWEAKNLQLLLHARVIGNTPAQPEMVASHVW
jgi:hypothetical protein